ncbi:MAG: division/cell wall cluster transcriptional repressor MraZ [Pseudomonadota bacterium]
MRRGFRGEFDQKVDGKGRISIPADFRGPIEAGDPDWSRGKAQRFIIVYGNSKQAHLECYTIEAAAEVEEKISRLPRGSMQRKTLERLFSGYSLECTVDETGRIVLPLRLRKKIGLDGMAYFIASGDTFQIWKPETFEAVELQKADEWLEQFPDDFDPLTLLDQVGE